MIGEQFYTVPLGAITVPSRASGTVGPRWLRLPRWLSLSKPPQMKPLRKNHCKNEQYVVTENCNGVFWSHHGAFESLRHRRAAVVEPPETTAKEPVETTAERASQNHRRKVFNKLTKKLLSICLTLKNYPTTGRWLK